MNEIKRHEECTFYAKPHNQTKKIYEKLGKCMSHAQFCHHFQHNEKNSQKFNNTLLFNLYEQKILLIPKMKGNL